MGTGTQLGRVRGLGSAHEGVEHWWRQKLTAGSNFLLMAWLLISLAMRPSFGYPAMHAWLASPWAAWPSAGKLHTRSTWIGRRSAPGCSTRSAASETSR